MTLLVFKVNQLGDNVVFLPVVQALAATHPGWRIIVATSPVAAPLYRVTCPQVEVLEFPTAAFNAAWRKPWSLLPMAARLRALRPDACLVANDQGNVAHLLARLSGASHCVGPLVAGRTLGGLLHQRVPLLEDEAAPLQNWRIAQALVAHLGLSALPAQPPAPDLTAFGRDDHGGVVIHPGASRAYQRWPLDRYVKLANQLCEAEPVLWMVQGEPAESALDTRVRRVKPESLAALIRCLAGARLFIGNNSGPMHIASALGIPGVVPAGPSTLAWDPFWHRDRFDLLREPLLPCQPCDKFGQPANVCLNIQQPHACLERWTVENVHALVLARLAKVSAITA